MKQLETKFDYNSVTPQIAEFLRSKEVEMSNIIGKAYTEIGQELKEVQDELSKNGYGCFEDWYTKLGFKKDQVYRWIGRYELILANCDKRELIEELPISLSYETSKPSIIPELKQQVLDGEITSLKQFKDLEKQLKETERERVRLENESVHYRQLLNQERSKPSQVVTKEIKVEVVPSDYQDLKTQAVAGQKLSTENVQLQRTIQQMKEETTRADETSQLCKKLRESFKNLLSTVNQEHYNAKFYFDQVAGSQQTFQIVQAFQQEFNEIINTVLLDWKDRTEIKPNLRSV